MCETSTDYVSLEDAFYGDQNAQIDLHNGEVSLTFESAAWLLSVVTSLTEGVEGSGNYVIFYNDKIQFISDSTQIGTEQYVEIRPDPKNYTFAPQLTPEAKRPGRVVLKVKFSNIKQILTQCKAVKSKNKSVSIRKERAKTDLEIVILSDGVASSPHTVTCSTISHPPQPKSLEGITPTWYGSVQNFLESVSTILSSKAELVHVYIKNDGTGLYFYAYHATSGHGSRGSLGKVSDKDFVLSDKNTKLVPVTQNYLHYSMSRKGLKTLQKLNNEFPDELALTCVTDKVIALSCNVGGNSNTHVYYFA